MTQMTTRVILVCSNGMVYVKVITSLNGVSLQNTGNTIFDKFQSKATIILCTRK